MAKSPMEHQQHQQQQRKWRITIDSKARNFVFKVRATASTSFQSLYLHKFSFIFMLYHFKVRVESDQPKKSLKSRFLRLVEKIPNPKKRRKPNKTTEIEAKNLPVLTYDDVLKRAIWVEVVRLCCLLVGILGCVIGAMYGVDLKGLWSFCQVL